MRSPFTPHRAASFHRAALLICSLAGLLVCARAAEVKFNANEVAFFESKIRPILVDNCYKCHSQGAEKIKGGLLLDSREGTLKGGDTGPALVPGQPDKSLLIKAVQYQDKDLQMPPNDKKLSDAQIADLIAWVKLGAPDPRTAGVSADHVYKLDMEKGKKHWAFQPVKSPPVPAATDANGWVKSPVDAFILARLLEKGLSPSAPADKVTLLRRATFGLTGLPPTTRELESFLADNTPGAFATVVDRLLKSPRYGERWGRYWLDVARYGDTKGPVGNNGETRFLYSHTYRDWVIRALNEDLPYDQFLLQQLAADKLPPGEDKRSLAALGFLTCGNRFNNQKNEIIDDRIDVVAKGTMGLTVVCARCHDHKFDPIPTKDYYSLHGVFNNCTDVREGPLLETPKDTPAYREFQKEVVAREAAVAQFREKVGRDYAAEVRGKIDDYFVALHEFRLVTNGMSINAFMQRKNLRPGMAQGWENYLKSRAKKHDPVFAPWLAFDKLSEAEFKTKARELAAKFYANKEADKPINREIAVLFANMPTTINQVAARYAAAFAKVDKNWQQTLAGYEAAKRALKTPPPEPSALTDAAQEQLRQALYAKNSPAYVGEQQVEQFIQRDNPTRDRLQNLVRAVNDVKASHPGSPPRALVLEDTDKPRDSFVMVKGNPGNKGPVVPRQFLEVLAGEKRQPFKEGSGRLELAKAIASKDNPLTARVFVNRVWLHHFGEGFVPTPDDFGTRSEPPTHPELLDYLAARFMEEGWSIKRLHRLLLLSAVYQQGSDEDPRKTQIDPDNKWYWQMNRRRLDFEGLRDTILFIGGKLDLAMGGPPVELNAEPYSERRSVYGVVNRNNLPNMYRAFDFANPDLVTGKRDSTIVPQQALFMMNSPLVVEQARNLVLRPDFAAQSGDEAKIKLLYQLIYQRVPSETELKLARNYLQSEAGSAKPLPAQAAWEYGFGEFDVEGKEVRQFFHMAQFNGTAWLPGNQNRNPGLGNVNLTATGGVPGRKFAAIRRWTAPRDGFISIDGLLEHKGKPGDGVFGRIVSSQHGALGGWVAQQGQAATKLPRVLVKKGGTIDFMVECRANPQNDAFTWMPTVRLIESTPRAGAADLVEWNAQRDFSGTMQTKGLDAWEKFAQVLLETNELTFVN